MEKIESVQYNAARTITGKKSGTLREKLYTELGWELLSCRRWSRRLILFYKTVYTKDHNQILASQQRCRLTHKAKTENSNTVSILTAYLIAISLNLI